MPKELCNWNARTLAKAIEKGDVSTLEVVDAHLERIAAVNPAVNAVTNVLRDSSREAAKQMDRLRSSGEVLGPLAGVPFTVKENIDVAGSATTPRISTQRPDWSRPSPEPSIMPTSAVSCIATSSRPTS